MPFVSSFPRMTPNSRRCRAKKQKAEMVRWIVSRGRGNLRRFGCLVLQPKGETLGFIQPYLRDNISGVAS
jgi:hypothetical protein